jgi:carbonic anhydrase
MESYTPGNETTPFPSVNATLSLSHLLNNGDYFDYWFYQGSATFPPCFKGIVSWVIPKRTYSMSQAQRDFFWNLFNGNGKDGNWRALQPLQAGALGFYQFGH